MNLPNKKRMWGFRNFHVTKLPFSPDQISALREWHDYGDRSTLHQDNAATTSVTAVGQPVRHCADKSGNSINMLVVTIVALACFLGAALILLYVLLSA